MMNKMKNWFEKNKETLPLRLFLYMIGVGIMPFGVVLTINSHFGAGGVDALNFVIAERLGIETSFAIYGMALLVVLLTACIRRSFPRFTTFIASFLMGLFTDFWKSILSDIQGISLISQVVIMLLGLIIVGFAVAAYMCSDFPTNPNDDFVVALHERGISIRAAKMSFDIICVVAAFILGGEIGVGTILCTFVLGPVIDFFYKIMTHIPVIAVSMSKRHPQL